MVDDDLCGGSVPGQIDRSVCIFGGLSAVRVGLDWSVISRPAFRICQVQQAMPLMWDDQKKMFGME